LLPLIETGREKFGFWVAKADKGVRIGYAVAPPNRSR
jgi:hypothetical protein